MSDDGYDSMDAERDRLWRKEMTSPIGHYEPPDWNAQPTPELIEKYRVKSSGQKVFPSGAMRDSATDKPRYDLIDPGMLYRLAEHMRKGAEHYGEHNWTKGIPSTNYMASLLRHVEAYRRGERDEDHLAAAVFNIMGLMRNEGGELDDLFDWGQS